MDSASTPSQGVSKNIMRITANQKQALIDNLQLEVTERARKLRAQYALQAHSLRTRIELRVNRIPTAVRKANMGDLFLKYEEMRLAKERKQEVEEPKTENHSQPGPETETNQEPKSTTRNASTKTRGTKRKSDALDTSKNETVKIHEDPIPNPKKRAKGATNNSAHQAPNPSTVLSPKSANSRTLPQSPIQQKGASPEKPFHVRTASPLKPLAPPPKMMSTAAATASLAHMAAEKAKPGRPKAAGGKSAATRGRKEAERAVERETMRTISSTSNSSALSTGTTIVSKATKPATKATRKAAVAKNPARNAAGASDPPQTGRRVLRKRA
ncbi:MAG: hypothetical protein OHK93_002549 [Ramalina farinacea]|uniref:Borealin N-terminal domain-containing protein n=1 Tax=Ramalina farinacea TaxID=258253 RepID=A0AA43TYV4_9LECA|nr:hypothetical protein [Ramalina farinacea]